MQTDFRDPEWKENSWDVGQCAGAAIMRTHIGVAPIMPDALPCLPPAPEVFKTLSEFVAHHKGLSLAQAHLELTVKPPRAHLNDQLKRPDNKTRPAS
jgi:hypothetical protein